MGLLTFKDDTMKRKYSLVAVGGTFDRFHKGHRRLLDEAFCVGETVMIGVTSDEFAAAKGEGIEPCSVRMKNLEEYLRDKDADYHVMRLDDPYGTTVTDEAFEAIVVSRETEPVAREINEIRRNRGFRELDIITIDMVNADDGIPISSTRIRRGEIDPMGHIIRRIRGALRRRRE